MKVRSSYQLAHKLIVFIDSEAVLSPPLNVLLEDELKKHQRSFSEIVVIGSNNADSVVFQS